MTKGEAERLKNEGNARKAADDLAGAAERYRGALALDPAYAPALYNLGLVLEELGRAEEAEDCFRKVLALDTGDAEALVRLGALLCGRGAHAEAIPLLERALRQDPASPHGHFQLGIAQAGAGAPGKAISSLQAALALEPEAPEIHGALGRLLLREEKGAEAAEHLLAAIRAQPSADLHNDLGAAYLSVGRTEDALKSFRAALASQPDLAEARLNLGDFHMERGDHAAAAEHYGEGLRRDPGNALFTERLLSAMQQLCDWSRFDELCGRLLAILRERPQELTATFALLSLPATPADQLLATRAQSERLERRAAADGAPALAHRARGPGRLRIGYLSADFREHVMAYILAELFELHDRGRFELFGYSYGPDDGSERRSRIASAMDHFADLRAMGDREAAERIHADAVEILVDLNGYTQAARSAILAHRPAPVQVNFLGYPGTMGARFMDYIVVDGFLWREGDERNFAEKPVLMPACYAPSDTRRRMAAAPSREALGLPQDAVVFCCFNQAFKILPEVFASWMRILRGAPGSVLWLLEANPAASANLRREAARHGLDPLRLVFAPRVAPEHYLARLAAADLFLDTRPYNAHTTSADALWVGVPVLTWPGDTFASRVAGSMLATAGLRELVAASLQDYEALALWLARAPEELQRLRSKLQAARATSPLFDMPRYARHLERGYEIMAEERSAGRAAASIDLR